MLFAAAARYPKFLMSGHIINIFVKLRLYGVLPIACKVKTVFLTECRSSQNAAANAGLTTVFFSRDIIINLGEFSPFRAVKNGFFAGHNHSFKRFLENLFG